jgi:hypothetical protein
MTSTVQQRRRQLRERLRALTYSPLMRGSVYERRRKCGQPSCGCATDPERQHPGKFLSVHLDGRTRGMHVRPEDEAAIAQALMGYQKLWEVLNELTALEYEELRRAARERRKARREGQP